MAAILVFMLTSLEIVFQGKKFKGRTLFWLRHYSRIQLDIYFSYPCDWQKSNGKGYIVKANNQARLSFSRFKALTKFAVIYS